MKEVYSNLPILDYKSLVAESKGVKAVEYAHTIMLNGLAAGFKLPVDELIQIIKLSILKTKVLHKF